MIVIIKMVIIITIVIIFIMVIPIKSGYVHKYIVF